MGYHNRVLSKISDLEKDLSSAKEHLGRSTSEVKDLDEVVRSLINISVSAIGALAEIYDSCGPFISKQNQRPRPEMDFQLESDYQKEISRLNDELERKNAIGVFISFDDAKEIKHLHDVLAKEEGELVARDAYDRGRFGEIARAAADLIESFDVKGA